MRLILLLAAALVLACGSAQHSQTPTAQSNQSAKIPEGEAHFTPEQLNEYYLVYKNADVKYLRIVFDAYLNGSGGTPDELQWLKKWNKEYFRSKFVVMSRNNNTFVGTLIMIMFQDLPDKVFIAWVYPEGENGQLKLRRFEPNQTSQDDIKRIQTRYRALLKDKTHAM